MKTESQIKQQLDSLLDKMPQLKEIYLTNPFAKSCIDSLNYGKDPYELIEVLVLLNIEMKNKLFSL